MVATQYIRFMMNFFKNLFASDASRDENQQEPIFVPTIDVEPVMTVAEAGRIRNVNEIAENIEKVHRILERVKESGNKGAIQTWSIVMTRLKTQWMDAMIEVKTHGTYSNQ